MHCTEIARNAGGGDGAGSRVGRGAPETIGGSQTEPAIQETAGDVDKQREMVQPTRALIIEDDPDYESLLRSVLSGGFDVMSAPTLAGGLTRLQQFRFDVILLDLNLPDSAGYSTFLRVSEAAGGSAVIVLTTTDEDQLAIKAVEDGAQDYLVKSTIEPGLLPRYIHMALGRQSRAGSPRRPAAGLVLGFLGSKGGVGTSTVAVNLAALLAQSGADTTFVELGGGPGATSLYLQTQPAHDLSWLLERPADEITAAGLRQCTFEPVLGLRMISTLSSPWTSRAIGADYVRAIASSARRLGTHVVLDFPAGVDEGIAAAVATCDALCMVVDREPAAVQGAAAVLRRIGLANARSIGVSIIAVDRTRLEDRFPPAEFRRQLAQDPLVAIQPAAAAICVSHSARIPLVSLYPEDAFSLSIRELAERLLAPSLQGVWAEPYRKPSNAASYWRTIPETTYS
jgi:MinD-like ATPase involved in chromosome partitioning or flagellar assembly/CheY-like chemotaxis protein